MRKFLAQTGSAVAAVPQSDVDLEVGPQVDVGNAVATLLDRAGYHPAAAAPRVAVEQRQQASALGGTISTATDAANVSLSGRLLNAWITVSPDWVGLPASGVTYRLAATTGPKSTLSRTAWARLQPAAILAAAGLPLASTTPRTVELAYRASADGHVLANVPVTLTLGPTDGTSPSALAPVVPAVSSASTIPVQYDISQISNPVNPTLVVSEPGRVDPVTGQFFRPAYSVPLRASSGVVQVPVSALQGAGIYGIGIQSAPGGPSSTNYTAFAFTRVGPVSAPQPAAPQFSYQGSTPSHFVEVPYHAPFQMQYDVRSVPGATGAAVEVSAAGPTSFNNNNPFNNPNGSVRDNNGSDFGSVAFAPLPATHGTATLNSASLGMYPAMNHVVRVLALRGGAVIGEASGVSTAIMDGVRPADGGFITNGYSINSHGTDGFLTSDQATASGQILGSVETFDQATNTITSTVASTSHVYGTLMGGCPGAFHGDVGLYDDSTPAADTFRVLNPIATGTQSGTWTPSPADVADGLLCPAPNQTTDDTAVLAGLGGPGATYRVFTSNVGQNTFGAERSLAPATSTMGFPIAGGIAQNTTTGNALVGVADLTNLDGPGKLVSVNLGDGSVTSTPTVTTRICRRRRRGREDQHRCRRFAQPGTRHLQPLGRDERSRDPGRRYLPAPRRRLHPWPHRRPRGCRSGLPRPDVEQQCALERLDPGRAGQGHFPDRAVQLLQRLPARHGHVPAAEPEYRQRIRARPRRQRAVPSATEHSAAVGSGRKVQTAGQMWSRTALRPIGRPGDLMARQIPAMQQHKTAPRDACSGRPQRGVVEWVVARYVAFLRAVNVGRRRVAMATAREILSGLGLDEVSSYVNSGNLLFSAVGKAADHEAAIRSALEAKLGFELTTFVRTAAQVRTLVEQCPFGELAAGHTHFALLPLARLTAREKRRVEAMSNERDEVLVRGRDVHWLIRAKSTETTLGPKQWLDALPGNPTTARNMTMLTKLAERL